MAGATMRNRLSWQGNLWFMSTIRERNKEKILRAASEEFADKGFAATKTSDIAAKAGLPKPNVYYYFKSKDNLYREVLESIIEPILAASTPFNPDGDPKQVLSGYIRSKIGSPPYCRLLCHTLRPKCAGCAPPSTNPGRRAGAIGGGTISNPAICSTGAAPLPCAARRREASTGRSVSIPKRVPATQRTVPSIGS